MNAPLSSLVFLDVETTGLDAEKHEMLQIGLLEVDPQTLLSTRTLNLQVKPERLSEADPEALKLVGYSEDKWKDAFPLKEACQKIAPYLEGSMLGGHNIGFDRNFLKAAFSKVGLSFPKMNHHVLDTASLAFPLLMSGALKDLSLKTLCAHFDIHGGTYHDAFSDAGRSLELARRLLKSHERFSRITVLKKDEPRILDMILERLVEGQTEYGPWNVKDGRNYRHETLLEILDGMAYMAGELVRWNQPLPKPKKKKVYICHPFRDAPEENQKEVRLLCQKLLEKGEVPIAPQVYLPQFIDEEKNREEALSLCLSLLEDCDELRVFGAEITEGMRAEIDHAQSRGIRVSFSMHSKKRGAHA